MIVEEDVENGYDSWNEMQSLHIPIPRDIHVSHQQTINTLATCLSITCFTLPSIASYASSKSLLYRWNSVRM